MEHRIIKWMDSQTDSVADTLFFVGSIGTGIILILCLAVALGAFHG